MTNVRTLAPADYDTDAFRAFIDATRLGFNDGASTNDKTIELCREAATRDAARMRGVWSPTSGMSDRPVATFGSFDGTINTGAGLAAANFITDVTVRATHKRRGLLRAMMTLDLAEAVDRGVAFATLTATDATIYGRFGFGRAVGRIDAEIDSGPKYGLRTPATGQCEFVEQRDLLDDRARLVGVHLATRRGAHSRLHYYNQLGYDWDKEADDHSGRGLAHYDASGNLDGFAYFKPADEGKTIKVRELFADNPAAELALWDVLCGIELSTKVTTGFFDPASPLQWALADPRVLTLKPVADLIWLRILDVPKALEARGFDTDGDLTLGVRDSLGHAEGTYRVSVRDGRAEVTASDAEADLSLDVAELGSLYFGMADVRTLAGAGLAHGPGIAATHDLFRVNDQPFCTTAF